MEDKTIFIYIMASILLMLSFAIAVIWFFTYAQKRIISTKLKQKEMEIIFQKELLTNAVTIQETERDRIAKELHDEIGSKLNIASLNMHLLKSKIIHDEDSDTIFLRLDDALKSSAERTRTISHELMPPVFQNFGFAYAIEELQNSFNATSDLRILITDYQQIKITNKIKLLHIYRIIQELLSNTIKHAQATSINILFERQNEDVLFTYTDNGLGFDTRNMPTGMGFGNIKTRAELLDGTINYTSSLGKGFELTIKFPNHD
jgi:signal transduction histidine kinase